MLYATLPLFNRIDGCSVAIICTGRPLNQYNTVKGWNLCLKKKEKENQSSSNTARGLELITPSLHSWDWGCQHASNEAAAELLRCLKCASLHTSVILGQSIFMTFFFLLQPTEHNLFTKAVSKYAKNGNESKLFLCGFVLVCKSKCITCC